MKATVNENLKAGETSTIHRFEQAGLGKAPFRFTGRVTENVIGYPHCDPKPGGCCDYCFTGIRYEFWVRSADGKEFKVGSNCIHKTGDAGLIQQIAKAERELRDKKNAAARERKKQRIAERVEAAKKRLPFLRDTLDEQPHPNTYYANQGKTLLDYVQWCLENGAEEKAAGLIEREDACYDCNE